MKKPKPPHWEMCQFCPTGSVLRNADGQLLDCLTLAERRRPKP
jgi:hypothetical protein